MGTTIINTCFPFKRGRNIKIKPYGIGGTQEQETEDGNSSESIEDAGLDLYYGLKSNLTLNLTYNTDFAQVEADRIPVNLTRFSVYYPEKRQFFLEGYDMFNFYLGDRNNAFYTREIGIENGKQIPIVAGARIFGKAGKNNIGFLNIQEGSLDSIPTTNNTVFRYKRDVGKQSYIGGIFTNKINEGTRRWWERCARE